MSEVYLSINRRIALSRSNLLPASGQIASLISSRRAIPILTLPALVKRLAKKPGLLIRLSSIATELDRVINRGKSNPGFVVYRDRVNGFFQLIDMDVLVNFTVRLNPKGRISRYELVLLRIKRGLVMTI